MNTASITPNAHASSTLPTRTASARSWLISTRAATLACAALWFVYGATAASAAGPYLAYQGVFIAGAVLLVTGLAWVLPFLGAMLCMIASLSAWIFLDTTPDNALLAASAFVLSCLLLHRWHVERDAEA